MDRLVGAAIDRDDELQGAVEESAVEENEQVEVAEQEGKSMFGLKKKAPAATRRECVLAVRAAIPLPSLAMPLPGHAPTLVMPLPWSCPYLAMRLPWP